jgi:hypothetical protein
MEERTHRNRHLTLDNVFKNEIALNIIYNLGYYIDINVGLEQKHLRFLLMEEYATPEQIKNDPQVAKNIEEITKFLSQHRKGLYRKPKNPVKNRSLINYYLNQLGEGKNKNGLGLIRTKPISVSHKYTKTRRTRYVLTKKGQIELTRHLIKTILNRYNFDDILPFYNGTKFNQTFFGITEKERKSLTSSEKEEFRSLQEVIFKSMLKIEGIIKKEKSNESPKIAFVQIPFPSN